MGSLAPSPDVRPLVDRVARHISDPVLRLRFLKATAPVGPGSRGGWRRGFRWLWMGLLAALVATLVVLVPLLLLARLRASTPIPNPPAHAAAPLPAPAAPAPAPALAAAAEWRAAPDVWLVERSGEIETYSNGLRIDSRFLVATHPRSYLAFPADGRAPLRRTEPAGIVFHTTESRLAPFEAGQNRVLRRLGESLLEYVRRRQAYNFVIDRFGRVYRIVAEDQAANHSGYSAWADEDWRYINLNESFLGISFEAVSPAAREEATFSAAQARAAATLVELLRRRYRIAAANCVTHAQISVNPDNMRVGAHVDWASGFPFEAIGLPDNYTLALPAVWAYGFDTDPGFTSRAGAGLNAGIGNAVAMVAQRAAAGGLRPEEYRKGLRRRYREMLALVRRSRPDGADPE